MRPLLRLQLKQVLALVGCAAGGDLVVGVTHQHLHMTDESRQEAMANREKSCFPRTS